ncbi:MAG: ELWxxDGT repeat protein [Melioribacteraceae bacterium]
MNRLKTILLILFIFGSTYTYSQELNKSENGVVSISTTNVYNRLSPPEIHDLTLGAIGSILILAESTRGNFYVNLVIVSILHRIIFWTIVLNQMFTVNTPATQIIPSTPLVGGPPTYNVLDASNAPNGFYTGITEIDIFPSERIGIRGNNTEAQIFTIERSTGNVISELTLPFASSMNSFRDGFDVGFNNTPSKIDRGFFNFNGEPALLFEDPVTGVLGYEVFDVNPGASFSQPTEIVIVETVGSSNGGLVFFAADDGTHGRELFISDGTSAGTKMVKDIHTTFSSFPYDLTAMNNKLYFVGASNAENSELWVSDGTELGTMLIKDINPTFGHSNITNLMSYNNMLYFRATNGVDGTELWKSDGTTSGTIMIKDINQSSSSAGSNPYGFTPFKNKIIFIADDGIHGHELWITDGSLAGTVLVKNINNTGDGSASSNSIMPGIVNGDVFYFYADDGVHGKELWMSDGTREGTTLAYDINPGSLSSNSWAGWGVLGGGALYVAADDGVIGHELLVFENVPTSVPSTTLSLKLFLEGAYSSNKMTTNLSSAIPFNQPYNKPPLNYNGDERIDNNFISTNKIVDWVLVELRTGSSAVNATTIFARKAVPINEDGLIVDPDDGTTNVNFSWVDAGEYFITVYHRNHLAVISSQEVTLTN